jgi:hypothetical protein
MTRPRARAGAPYIPPMDCGPSVCTYPEGECIDVCRLHRVPELKPLPVEMHEPERGSFRFRVFQLFKGNK